MERRKEEERQGKLEHLEWQLAEARNLRNQGKGRVAKLEKLLDEAHVSEEKKFKAEVISYAEFCEQERKAANKLFSIKLCRKPGCNNEADPGENPPEMGCGKRCGNCLEKDPAAACYCSKEC